jgi:hypothetical protein
VRLLLRGVRAARAGLARHLVHDARLLLVCERVHQDDSFVLHARLLWC